MEGANRVRLNDVRGTAAKGSGGEKLIMVGGVPLKRESKRFLFREGGLLNLSRDAI